MRILLSSLFASLLLLTACGDQAKPDGPNSKDDPSGKFRVRLETTKGNIVIEVDPALAPIGAAHFKKLVETGYYTDIAFFRVIKSSISIAQFGMHGDPAVNRRWSNETIQDEPVRAGNHTGTVTFAKTSAPNSRSTHIFLNMANNSVLDRQGFAPIGKVVEGLDLVHKLYDGYGDRPDQGMIAAKGNAYLAERFPKLDYIERAVIE